MSTGDTFTLLPHIAVHRPVTDCICHKLSTDGGKRSPYGQTFPAILPQNCVINDIVSAGA